MAQSVPTFDRDPCFGGRRLDVVVHNSTHPVWLHPFHFWTGEDVIAILGIGSLAPPSPQFLKAILIKRAFFGKRFPCDQCLV